MFNSMNYLKHETKGMKMQAIIDYGAGQRNKIVTTQKQK